MLDPGPPAGSWQVTQIGGYDPNVEDANGQPPGHRIDSDDRRATLPKSGLEDGPSLNLPRSYQNTVLLPDGSMVAVGGGIGFTVADQNLRD